VYAVREAVKGMMRTPYMSFLSVVSISVTLTVFGVFIVVTLFANGLVEKLRSGNEINIYLKDEMSDEDMLALDAVISSMKEVETTRILSKEDARVEFERMFGRGLLDALDENPLPRTIVVVMADGHRTADDMERVAERVSRSAGVESIDYGREWISRLDILFVFLVMGEAVLIVFAVAACILIISTTVSMTVLSRKETIEIMRLVGATDGFIRRPFYVEGLLQGLISGTAAFGVLYGASYWLYRSFPGLESVVFMFAVPGGGGGYVFQDWWTALIIPLGAFLGLLGSFLAVRRVF